VTSGLDEVNACMYAVVYNVDTVDLVLRVEVGIKSLFNVFDYRAPGDVVVDKVTKARGVDDGQTKTDSILFNVGTDGLYGDGFGADVEARWFALLRGVKRCVEECVYKSRLSKAGFT
jgi:hypothetical protein